MRMLVRIKIATEKGNEALKNGTMKPFIKSQLERLRPEAAYFYPESGSRCMLLVVDVKDSSDIPSVADPFTSALNATVEFTPVMNAHDLTAGLDKLEKLG